MALTRIGLNQSINLASNVTGTLATGNGGTGATSFAPGKVLQVVSAQEGQVRSTTSGSFGAISGVTLDITPSSTSSKVLVFFTLVLSCTNHGVIRFKRDSTVIGAGITASGSRQDASMTSNSDGNTARPQTFNFLDSPSKSSATTYFAEWIANSGSNAIYLNRTPNDTDATYGSRFASTITLMEIEG